MAGPKGSNPNAALRQARKEAGLTLDALAKKAGTSRQQIARLEKDPGEPQHRKLTREWAERLGPYVNRRPVDLVFDDEATDVPARSGLIPLLGEVAAGRWIEIESFDREPEQWLPFTPEPGMSEEGVYALRVRGNSMDRIAPDGSMIICRDLGRSGADIEDHDLVIVERLRQQEGLREVTLKRVQRMPRGGVQLNPESTDPRWKPVLYSGRKQADALDLRVIATVEYIVTPVRRRRR